MLERYEYAAKTMDILRVLSNIVYLLTLKDWIEVGLRNASNTFPDTNRTRVTQRVYESITERFEASKKKVVEAGIDPAASGCH